MEQDITEIVVRLVYQLALILTVAKVGGEICVRYLKVPPVLGELVAGVIIGPFALGGIVIGGAGPVFLIPAAYAEAAIGVPISSEL